MAGVCVGDSLECPTETVGVRRDLDCADAATSQCIGRGQRRLAVEAPENRDDTCLSDELSWVGHHNPLRHRAD